MSIVLFTQGNYDSYVKTRAELEENQMKQYNREQDQIKHMKVCCQLKLFLVHQGSIFIWL